MKTKKYIFGVFFLIIAVVVCLLFIFISYSQNNSTKNKFAIMSTTDIHGKVWDKDLVLDKDEPNNMLAESTAVNEVREKYKDKTLLWDNGDLYQGTFASTLPLSIQYSYTDPSLMPSVTCLEHIKYDGYNLGNHEFNYLYDDMNKYYEYLGRNNIKLTCANIYYKGSGQRVFDPYYIKDIDVDGVNVRIAVIGLENTDIPRWDSTHRYKNWIFHSLENPNGDISYEIKKVQKQIEDDGINPDFTIVSYHGGFFRDGVVGEDQGDYLSRLEEQCNDQIELYKNSESQAYKAVRKTRGIDMFIFGHDHKSIYSNSKIKNAEGNDTLVVNGAKVDLTCSEFSVEVDSNTGKKKIQLEESNNLHFKDYTVDTSLKHKLQSYINDVQNILDINCGKVEGDWHWNPSSDEMLTRQTDQIDFINRSNMWYAKAFLNTKFSNISEVNKYILDETSDSSMQFTSDHPLEADLSVCGPVSSTVNLTDNNFKYKNVQQVCIYENNAEVIPVKGQFIKDLLEYNAENRYKVSIDEGGNKKIELINDKYTCPVFYGINFEYNMNNAPGSRVEIFGFSSGRSFDINATYIIAINNYLTGNTSNTVLEKMNLKYNLFNSNTDGKTYSLCNVINSYLESFHGSPVYPTSEAYKNNETVSHWSIKY